MASRSSSARARSFLYRAGTRIAETIIACDAHGGSDLLFLSNARALNPRAPRRGLGRVRSSRGQILTTAETLALLGTEGDRLRPRALTPGLGRPFTLGKLRLELLPGGHLPGAAALLCEDGSRRMLFAGAVRPGDPTRGAPPAAVRPAQALCIDATFGHPRFHFVSQAEADAAACRFAGDAREAGCAPVILAAPFGIAQEIAPALVQAGWKLRAHRSTVAATAAYRRAGVATPPMTRFSGALARDEVLLWPASERGAGLLARLGRTRMAWISGLAADETEVRRMAVDEAIAYSIYADFAGLLAYVTATGASEVATLHGFAEDLATELRRRDVDAYAIGPPRQIALFSAEP